MPLLLLSVRSTNSSFIGCIDGKNMRMRLPILFALLAFLSVPLAPSANAAIKVIVNDTPITDYDITQRARLITLTERKNAATAKRQAEQELIDDQVKLAEAERYSLNVSNDEVEAAYNNIARSVKMSPSQLGQALGRSGVKADTLKARLKAQLAWNKVVQRRVRGRVEVDESDIIAALQKTDEAERNLSIEYDLRRIIVVVPKKSSNSFKSKRKRESNQIRQAFPGCDDAGSVLGQYSEVVVRPIGRRLETELPDNMRDEINNLEVGKLTKPSPTPVGYEMIAICGKREIASDIAARTKLESELMAKETQTQERRVLMDARRRATIIYK